MYFSSKIFDYKPELGTYLEEGGEELYWPTQ